jgi:Ca2+-binding RTX toxin-like protein
MSTNYFSRINGTNLSTTGTGLDQLVDTMSTDLGLRGRVSNKDITEANQAADAMNKILIEAINETGVAPDGQFDVDDIRALNTYIRENYLQDWIDLHGDDENDAETGFHLIQNDGASEKYRGDNLTDTVADGIYHLGFEIDGDNILNEDGDKNATLQQLAEWMTQFYTDHSTTNTGLDRMTDTVMADCGLDNNVCDSEIAEAADAANRMNAIIKEAIEYYDITADGEITVDDIRDINTYIRTNYLEEWATLHGDDESDEETGYHLVQNDGAYTKMFGKNFVDTVADGIYHLGFEIDGDYILNEDGNQNAKLTDLADWLNYFYVDQATTNTGLDELVQIVKSDTGLSKYTSANDINEGAEAANEMNHILVDVIQTLGIADDGVISVEDIVAINQYIRANHLQKWTDLHGDDESDEETGFHLVQNDGATEKYRGDNFINTVIDGIYHLGFEIQGDYILNEDGDQNANLGDLATWLNNFYLQTEKTFGSVNNDCIKTMNENSMVWARDGDDKVYAKEGDDQIWGGAGNDHLDGGEGDDHLYGESGGDTLKGRAGSDTLDGGEGDDCLYGYEGEDILLGGDGKDYLNGGVDNDTLDGGAGDDTLYGEAGNDHISAGAGADKVKAGDGDDHIYAGSDGAVDYLYGEGGADTFYFNVEDGGIGEDYVKYFSGEDGDRLVIDGENVGYLIQEDGGYHNVILTNKNTGDSMGIIKVYGQLSVGHISGTATVLDQISGDEGDNTIIGSSGDDVIYGNGGEDKLIGKDGDDYLDGGNDDDTLVGGDGEDHMIAGSGDDILKGNADNDTMDGGAGNDSLYGHEGNDQMFGGEGEDYIRGGIGNDVIAAGDGHDEVYGSAGDDIMDGGVGDDYLNGGAGNDTMFGGDGNDQMKGRDGIDIMNGGAGDDYLYGNQGDDEIAGGEGNDFIFGGDGEDLLIGEDGNDEIYGYKDDDILVDGAGTDKLYGGLGDDTLFALADGNDDSLKGGSGADQYIFQADGVGVGDDLVVGFSSTDGDSLVIGGPDVSYELLEISGNKHLVSLSDDQGNSMGSIEIHGEFSASDITVVEGDEYTGVMQNAPDYLI